MRARGCPRLRLVGSVGRLLGELLLALADRLAAGERAVDQRLGEQAANAPDKT